MNRNKYFQFFFSAAVLFLMGSFSAQSANANNITARLQARHTTGIAPLAVHFDATTTTDTNTSTDSFIHLNYAWSFGDTAQENVSWPYSGRGNSRNHAIGPIAAHVFEKPGSYVVNLTVTDGAGASSTTSTVVTVTDPVKAGFRTVCVSRTSNWSGCPDPSAIHETGSDASAIANKYITSNTQILFRRGETWSPSGSVKLHSNGPGLIGAYGTGARPVWNVGSGAFQVANKNTIRDWRVMDLDLRGQGGGTAIGDEGTAKQILFLRLNVEGFRFGIYLGNQKASYYNNKNGNNALGLHEEIFVVDSEIHKLPVGGSTHSRGMSLFSTHSAQLGNYMHDQGDGHTVRNGLYVKSLIQNNKLHASRAPATHVIKLHGEIYGSGDVGDDQWTEQVVISDNQLFGNQSAWVVTLQAQNNFSDERLRKIIFERNYVTSGPAVQVQLVMQTQDSVVRDNVFNLSGGMAYTGVRLSHYTSVAPAPRNTTFTGNKCYSGDRVSKGITCVSAGSYSKNGSNNLIYAPFQSGSKTAFSGSGDTGTNYVASSNPFVSSSLTKPLDFELANGSPTPPPPVVQIPEAPVQHMN